MKYINEEKISKIKLTKSNFYVAIDFDKTITANDSADSWDASGKMLGIEFNVGAFFNYRPDNASDDYRDIYSLISMSYDF